MAKKRRSPAQRAAFKKMISRNPKQRRKVHTNPVRHATKRQRVRRNPAPFRHRRRHRNPSEGAGLFSFIVSKEGLMMAAAVATTPTAMALAQEYILPTATGYYAAGLQAAVGLAAAWLTYKYVSKPTGQMVGLVALGTAAAQCVQTVQSGTVSKMSGYSRPSAPLGYGSQQRLAMGGYGSQQMGEGNMNGYSKATPEPGIRYM
jgi:hypothetical protein